MRKVYVAAVTNGYPCQVDKGLGLVCKAPLMSQMRTPASWLFSNNSIDSTLFSTIAWGNHGSWITCHTLHPPLQAALKCSALGRVNRAGLTARNQSSDGPKQGLGCFWSRKIARSGAARLILGQRK